MVSSFAVRFDLVFSGSGYYTPTIPPSHFLYLYFSGSVPMTISILSYSVTYCIEFLPNKMRVTGVLLIEVCMHTYSAHDAIEA